MSWFPLSEPPAADHVVNRSLYNTESTPWDQPRSPTRWLTPLSWAVGGPRRPGSARTVGALAQRDAGAAEVAARPEHRAVHLADRLPDGDRDTTGPAPPAGLSPAVFARASQTPPRVSATGAGQRSAILGRRDLASNCGRCLERADAWGPGDR
jgi:hypothetical protein